MIKGDRIVLYAVGQILCSYFNLAYERYLLQLSLYCTCIFTCMYNFFETMVCAKHVANNKLYVDILYTMLIFYMTCAVGQPWQRIIRAVFIVHS